MLAGYASISSQIAVFMNDTSDTVYWNGWFILDPEDQSKILGFWFRPFTGRSPIGAHSGLSLSIDWQNTSDPTT